MGGPRRPTVPAGSPTDAADEVKTIRGTPARAAARTAASAPADVHPQQHLRVRRAVGVDARHVVGELAALHAGGERVLVEQVAARHLGAAARTTASAASERASPTTSSPRSHQPR